MCYVSACVHVMLVCVKGQEKQPLTSWGTDLINRVPVLEPHQSTPPAAEPMGSRVTPPAGAPTAHSGGTPGEAMNMRKEWRAKGFHFQQSGR